MLADWLCPKICVDGVRRVNRPRMGRIGRIHTDLIRADPSDPPNPWSISPPNLASCLSQLDSNTQIGHYSNPNYLIFTNWYLRFVIWNAIANRKSQISNPSPAQQRQLII